MAVETKPVCAPDFLTDTFCNLLGHTQAGWPGERL
jgi:hypothetical protein